MVFVHVGLHTHLCNDVRMCAVVVVGVLRLCCLCVFMWMWLCVSGSLCVCVQVLMWQVCVGCMRLGV